MNKTVQRWIAACMLWILVLTGMTIQVQALQEPVLTEQSVRESGLVVYSFRPFSKDGKLELINELLCELRQFPVTADNDKGYDLIKPEQLLDKQLFTQSIEKSINPDKMTYVGVAPLRPGSKYLAFAVQFKGNPIKDRLILGVKITYRAKKDLSLDCTDADGKNRTLLVKKDGQIVYHAKVTVDYDQLIRLRFVPDYVSARVKLNGVHATGVTGETLRPQTEENGEIAYASVDKREAARINLQQGKLSAYPKLYTSKKQVELGDLVKGKTYFVRKFSPVTVTGSVTLSLENPFLTFEGDQVVPEKQICIYQLIDGKLHLVTKKFRTGKNHLNRSCFTITTDQLGTYIITDGKLDSVDTSYAKIAHHKTMQRI